jgi:hypothetical protein
MVSFRNQRGKIGGIDWVKEIGWLPQKPERIFDSHTRIKSTMDAPGGQATPHIPAGLLTSTELAARMSAQEFTGAGGKRKAKAIFSLTGFWK